MIGPVIIGTPALSPIIQIGQAPGEREGKFGRPFAWTAGKTLFGQTVWASLRDIGEPVDMVDIFRRSEAVPPIVDEALDVFPDLRTIWLQIGVEHAEAAAKARARGVDVIMNRCPKIEYQRLFGELRMGGFNTGVISSKL